MKRLTTILMAMLLMFSISACGAKGPTWQEQYDLGMKYLSEGNYEEAVIAFTAAIEIDPKQAPAYVGRGDAYTAQGDKLDDIERAYELYQKALEDYEQAVTLGSADAQSKLDGLQVIIQRLQASIEAEPLLKQLFALLSADDMEGAKNLMRQQEYLAMSAAADDGCFTYSEREGVCLAVYKNNCYYYGQWASGQRDGHGLWIQAAFDADSNLESRLYDGAWSNDLPNGDGKIISLMDLEKLQVQEGHAKSIRTEISGSFKNGLFHGTIYESWYLNDGDTHKWSPITAIDGVYQPIPNVPEDIQRRTFYQEKTAAGEYIVAIDQQDSLSSLWSSGSPRRVFGFSEG